MHLVRTGTTENDVSKLPANATTVVSRMCTEPKHSSYIGTLFLNAVFFWTIFLWMHLTFEYRMVFIRESTINCTGIEKIIQRRFHLCFIYKNTIVNKRLFNLFNNDSQKCCKRRLPLTPQMTLVTSFYDLPRNSASVCLVLIRYGFLSFCK